MSLAYDLITSSAGPALGFADKLQREHMGVVEVDSAGWWLTLRARRAPRGCRAPADPDRVENLLLRGWPGLESP